MRDTDKKWIAGSAVIEMSYILPMFFLLFIFIVHTVFYYHDKAVLNGAACETAVLGAQMERKKGTEFDAETFFSERISGKLIYMTDTEFRISEDEEEVTVNVSAAMSFMRLQICQRAVKSKPEDRIRLMR